MRYTVKEEQQLYGYVNQRDGYKQRHYEQMCPKCHKTLTNQPNKCDTIVSRSRNPYLQSNHTNLTNPVKYNTAVWCSRSHAKMELSWVGFNVLLNTFHRWSSQSTSWLVQKNIITTKTEDARWREMLPVTWSRPQDRSVHHFSPAKEVPALATGWLHLNRPSEVVNSDRLPRLWVTQRLHSVIHPTWPAYTVSHTQSDQHTQDTKPDQHTHCHIQLQLNHDWNNDKENQEDIVSTIWLSK